MCFSLLVLIILFEIVAPHLAYGVPGLLYVIHTDRVKAGTLLFGNGVILVRRPCQHQLYQAGRNLPLIVYGRMEEPLIIMHCSRNLVVQVPNTCSSAPRLAHKTNPNNQNSCGI